MRRSTLSLGLLLATCFSAPIALANSPSAPFQVAAADGSATLKQLMGKVMSSPGFEATVVKHETNINSGQASAITMKVFGKPPHTVKVEVLNHSKSPNKKGVKLLYSGGATKAKVQAGGALKFVKTELGMTSDDLVTYNNYRPDDVDLYGLAKRLSRGGYKVTLEAGNVLKIVPTGRHGLDPRIQYERIGFDPGSMKIKFWEAYANNKRFYLLDVQVMNYLKSAPAATAQL